MLTRMSRVLLPIVAAGVFIYMVIALGQAARDHLRQHEQYILHFADIDCPAPPGMRREAFLPEVQYLSLIPDRLPTLADDTPVRLAAAFARHPWVEKVEQVAIMPPDRAEVRLTFRIPVLAVPQPEGLRVVDGRGILLPTTASSEGLPVLRGTVAPPGLAGEAWNDPAVSAAAAVTGYLRPYRERLGLTTCEVRDGVVELELGSSRVVWGRAPGAEGEEPADVKLHRLLDTVGAREPAVIDP